MSQWLQIGEIFRMTRCSKTLQILVSSDILYFFSTLYRFNDYVGHKLLYNLVSKIHLKSIESKFLNVRSASEQIELTLRLTIKLY